ncbi:polyprenyl synthetase family protein [Paramicrobacterium agarici]|uniref:Geranylgeranyl diphosphate synthase type II n=1 Tax=Paramicrobacterium agarici TaxID=630514 RepID=A0A2A9DXJ2_9MICO|nr:polyprenyl synthetase family protein [Microbacterium agarici]PFG30639.1 geranylgeranyl diphosphate synthase type II [Microbacterium agarici]
MRTSAIEAPAVDLELDARLAEVIAERRRRAARFSQPYVQLWDAIADIVMRGKKLRPRLLLDGYHAFGGQLDAVALDAACAIELLHVALVIHDDVIDSDDVRRGELNITGRFSADAVARGALRTRAQNWGEASSLLAGDLMLTAAHSLIAQLDVDDETRRSVLEIFDEALFVSAAGEHADVWLSMHIDDASSYDVLAMMEHKTAAYSFQAPLLLAAALAGVDINVHERLADIGTHLGVIYQLRDDVLGVFGDEETIGKSTLSDLREGKETLLIAFARAHQRWNDVAEVFGAPHLTVADSERLREIIVASGALDLVEALIADRCDRVHELIADTKLPEHLRSRLTALATYCRTRRS